MHRERVLISELPSALDAFETIAPEAADLAIFLDYDGTLTPIVDRPQDAVLSDEMRETVRALAQRLTPEPGSPARPQTWSIWLARVLCVRRASPKM